MVFHPETGKLLAYYKKDGTLILDMTNVLVEFGTQVINQIAQNYNKPFLKEQEKGGKLLLVNSDGTETLEGNMQFNNWALLLGGY